MLVGRTVISRVICFAYLIQLFADIIMKLEIINPLDDNRWTEFVNSHPESDIFNHPAWMKVFAGGYKYKVFAVVKTGSDKNILAGIPFCEVNSFTGSRYWISLPFSDHCEPLFRNKDDLMEVAEFTIRQSEIYNIQQVRIYSRSGDNLFNTTDNDINHRLYLDSSEDIILGRMERTKRQGTAKALKEGLKAELLSDKNSIERFYKLHLQTRRRIGIPVQPKKIFKLIYQNIIMNDLGFTIIITKNGTDIAAGMFFKFNGKLIYKYNASNIEYLNYRPNNLLIWTAVNHGISGNYKYIDFGKTSSTNTGLRKFKLGWGAHESRLFCSIYPSIPENKNNRVRMKLMTSVIKASPALVCQLMGEVFYKFMPIL